MLRLGLTGGIGSGKSTVAAMLQARGAVIIDADAISRATTAVGGTAIEAIRRSFGAEFIDPHGALDRDRMRQATFADLQVRARLEAIIHPLVGEESARRESAALAYGTACVVFDIPLLVESGKWRRKVDAVLVVDCAAEVQIARVMARSGLARSGVEQIISVQVSRAHRLAAADVVVYNAGIDLCELEVLVGKVVQRLGL
ncbi:MAG: dephospho-CoA kinase [Burkholderiaceae bacterium]